MNIWRKKVQQRVGFQLTIPLIKPQLVASIYVMVSLKIKKITDYYGRWECDNLSYFDLYDVGLLREIVTLLVYPNDISDLGSLGFESDPWLYFFLPYIYSFIYLEVLFVTCQLPVYIFFSFFLQFVYILELTQSSKER